MELRPGQTAVVTGGASGIGAALARRFAARDLHVVMADVEEGAMAEAAAELGRLGSGEVLPVVTDVTDADSVQRLADAAVEAFGAVHVVCNNAGVAGSPDTAMGQVHIPSWRWVIEVNLMGVVHGHAAFLPLLRDQDEGHVVNTASIAGHFPGHSAYSASKWAVVGITEGLFHELGMAGSAVGASCLCPGWVRTQIMESHRNRPEWAAPTALAEPDPMAEEMRSYVRDQIAHGAAPDDVADRVLAAIEAKRLWVFTDAEMVASLVARFDAVLGDRNPPHPGLFGE
ncbi:MAG: SDR family NAD(P)-dependent oxidoreductase [Actinomycetota bacterium]